MWFLDLGKQMHEAAAKRERERAATLRTTQLQLALNELFVNGCASTTRCTAVRGVAQDSNILQATARTYQLN